jgi:Leucine-rich repeat (LRR) protein
MKVSLFVMLVFFLNLTIPKLSWKEYLEQKYHCSFENLRDTISDLTIRDENLKTIPEELFLCTKLRSIDLTMNKIEKISNNIDKWTNLEELDINYSPLRTVPPTIGKLRRLKVIWFLDDNISELPDEITGLDSLKELNLNGNPIRHLPASIGKLKNLRFLYLGQWNGVSIIPIEEQGRIKTALSNCSIKF